MNTKYLFPVLFSGAFLACSASSDGQQARVEVSRDGQARRLTQVMKYKVLIQEDQPAGQVVDFVLSDGGCIDYIVASYEDRYYTIPYSAATVRYDDSIVFVDLAPNRFEQVQFFANDDWPDFYVPAYQKQVFSTFGVDVVRRDGGATFRGDRDDDADDRREDRRERRDGRREERRDGDDDDRPRAKSRDRDRDEDVDSKDRPETPDRDQPKTTPKSKSEPSTPKADPKTPKSDPEKSPKAGSDKTPKADPKTPKSPNVNPPKPDAGNPKPLPKNPAPKKPESPKTPEPK